MASEVLEVAQHSGPTLVDGGPDGAGASSQAFPGVSPSPVPGLAPVLPGWQPEQAEQFLMTIWNMGCLFYGPQWRAAHEEFASWRDAAARLLGEVLPAPTADGLGGLTVAMVQCAGGIATMVVNRRQLIAAGPIIGKKKSKPPAAAPAPGIRTEGGEAGSKLTPQDADIIDLAARTRAQAVPTAAPSLAGLGYEG